MDKALHSDKNYKLQPEALESIYILYRITGDRNYQEYGWEIFQSLENYCKTDVAYSSIYNVDDANISKMYSMESPPELISLDKFVLNTEAHPFFRRSWE
ncbi:hypothetical protein INT45_013664 [Circinella minor]|uniref:mannosyl-oligosaccharide 1,2-alpha-mannosidase n=1 Tax=Circinella minor TaxID=1195481 RepID=A0A8H7SCK6_9FUNG|nr:hypothetical protein INT45_013664 [Circinella minor]